MNQETNPHEALAPVSRAIVDILHRDGRAPWSKVAEQVVVSATTVRRRYETMHRQGTIRVIGATDVARLGLGTPIIMRISNARSDLDVLIPRLRARTEVRSLNTLLGSVDIAAEIVLPPNVDYSRLVAETTQDPYVSGWSGTTVSERVSSIT